MNRRKFLKMSVLAIASPLLTKMADEQHPAVTNFSVVGGEGVLGTLETWKDKGREGVWKALLVAKRAFYVSGTRTLVYPNGKTFVGKPLVYAENIVTHLLFS